MYHRVLPGASPDGVSVEQFRRQLRYLRRRYDALLTGRQVERYLRGERGEWGGRRRVAAVTFDDGFLDNHLYATPVLRELGVPATLALSTELMAARPRHTSPDLAHAAMPSIEAYRRAIYHDDHAAFLSPTELRAMHRTGLWSLQAHGHMHRMHLWRLNPGAQPDHEPHWSLAAALGPARAAGEATDEPMGKLEMVSGLASPRREVSAEHPLRLHAVEDDAAYRRRALSDLTRCRDTIGGLTGEAPRLLCWPWGHWSRAGVEAATEAGFTATFGTYKGVIRPHDPRPVLPRIGVGPRWARFVRNVEVYRRPWIGAMYNVCRRTGDGEISLQESTRHG